MKGMQQQACGMTSTRSVQDQSCGRGSCVFLSLATCEASELVCQHRLLTEFNVSTYLALQSGVLPISCCRCANGSLVKSFQRLTPHWPSRCLQLPPQRWGSVCLH